MYLLGDFGLVTVRHWIQRFGGLGAIGISGNKFKENGE